VSDVGWQLHTNDLKSVYSKMMSHNIKATNAGWRAYESLKSERGWLSWGQDLRRDDMLAEAGLQSNVCQRKLQNQLFIGSQAINTKTEDKFNVLIKIENNNSIVWGLEPIWHKSKVIGLVRKGFMGSDQPLAFGYVYKKFLDRNHIPSNVQIEILGKLYNAKLTKVFSPLTKSQ